MIAIAPKPQIFGGEWCPEWTTRNGMLRSFVPAVTHHLARCSHPGDGKRNASGDKNDIQPSDGFCLA